MITLSFKKTIYDHMATSAKNRKIATTLIDFLFGRGMGILTTCTNIQFLLVHLPAIHRHNSKSVSNRFSLFKYFKREFSTVWDIANYVGEKKGMLSPNH